MSIRLIPAGTLVKSLRCKTQGTIVGTGNIMWPQSENLTGDTQWQPVYLVKIAEGSHSLGQACVVMRADQIEPVVAEAPSRRHGSPYDRGSADAYYGRRGSPHYFKGGTYMSDKVIELTEEETKEYWRGYHSVDKHDRKDWGHDDDREDDSSGEQEDE